MIELSNLKKYTENNRIEAKRALGGFPHSFWETYSAFANTMGGIILLGVEENADKSLFAVDLPYPSDLVGQLREMLNDRSVVSVNILTENDIRIEQVEGKHILIVIVPRANRVDRPVYIGKDPFGGTYRRNGEGDYKCAREEVQSMLRDKLSSQDSVFYDDMTLDALDNDSLRRYLTRLDPKSSAKSQDVYSQCVHIGAAKRDKNGALRPTAAGLLMFGKYAEIIKKFPDFAPNFKVCTETVFSEGETSAFRGNLFDFYDYACEKLSRLVHQIRHPIDTENENDGLYSALKEVLLNCLVNADFYSGSVSVEKEKDRFVFRNSGCFRLNPDTAQTGGISDPRNATVNRMFGLLKIGKGVGSGLPAVFALWLSYGWSTPLIIENYYPDRTELVLPLRRCRSKTSDQTDAVDKMTDAHKILIKAEIIRFLTDEAVASERLLIRRLKMKKSVLSAVLAELISSGIVVCDREKSQNVYRLKR